MLAKLIKGFRPDLDIILLADKKPDAILADPAAAGIRRVFYEVEEPLEIHFSILSGVAERNDTPFFNNLKKYAAKPVGTFHALPVARGKSIFKSNWIRDMGEFYGANLFLAESSATSGGLDSLLEPTGNIKKAQDAAARAFGGDRVFFVTNGTSTSNKMVHQALLEPGDIVIADRNCHKSHHYGMVLAGAQPYYVEAFPMVAYSMYGAVPLRNVKKALLDLKAAGRLNKVKTVTLTNCTFDGHVYDVRRVMEECLAIKPDLIFLWDEAWFGFARWSPLYRPRTAMGARAALKEAFADPAYLERYLAQEKAARRGPRPQGRARARHAADPRSAQGQAARLPDQLDAQVDVVPAPGLDGGGGRRGLPPPRAGVQGSGVHARLDLAQPADHRVARRRAPPDGARGLRDGDAGHPARDRNPHRGQHASARVQVLQGPGRREHGAGRVPAVGPQELHRGRRHLGGCGIAPSAEDEFILDPTRLTLMCGTAGYDGTQFKGLLANEYEIQLNKTSRNSILLQTNINNTRSDVANLLKVLVEISNEIEQRLKSGGDAARTAFAARVKSLVEDVPDLPNFSHFHDRFRDDPQGTTLEGDMRAGFYMAYNEDGCEYIKLMSPEIDKRIQSGPALVSANFVIPYPPGFPIMVPGQVIKADTIEFMRKLDVKEIHGYDATKGLKLISPSALEAKSEKPEKSKKAMPAPALARQLGADDHGLVLFDTEAIPGDCDLPDACHRVLLRQVHLQGHRPGVGHRDAAGRRPDRTDRDHHRAAAQGDGVPDVPVRRRLRGRAAVRARRRQGRRAAGALLGGPVSFSAC